MDYIIEYLSKWAYCYSSNNGWGYQQADIRFWISILIVLFWPALAFLSWKLFLWYKSRMILKDLFPFYDRSTLKYARKYFIPTKCQDVDPSNEHEISRNTGKIASEPLIPFFLNDALSYDVDHRYYMVLGDSGIGKSTFLINLYFAYTKKFSWSKYKIYLYPIGEPLIEKSINDIPFSDRKNSILLLDALDEDPQSLLNVNSRLDELLSKYRDFRKIVITCRTQFFESSNFEPDLTNIKVNGVNGPHFHFFIKKYISPFSPNDINDYLKKKFGSIDFKGKRELSKSIISQSMPLMVRPMLLSYIDDLINSELIHSKKIESHDIYRTLISRWIHRESARYGPHFQDEYAKQLHLFSIGLARQIFSNRTKSGMFISHEDLESTAKKHEITISFKELKGRSLLNRNATGQWKFAHKSIFEYLLAVSFVTENSLSIDRPGILRIDFFNNFDDLDQFKDFVIPLLFEDSAFKRTLCMLITMNRIINLINPEYDESFNVIHGFYAFIESLDRENLEFMPLGYKHRKEHFVIPMFQENDDNKSQRDCYHLILPKNISQLVEMLQSENILELSKYSLVLPVDLGRKKLKRQTVPILKPGMTVVASDSKHVDSGVIYISPPTVKFSEFYFKNLWWNGDSILIRYF